MSWVVGVPGQKPVEDQQLKVGGTPMEDYGTTAKFTQFTTVLGAFQSALAVVIGEIGIKKALNITHNQTAEIVRLLRVIFLCLFSGQKLVFEPKRPAQCEVLMTVDLGLFDLDQLSKELSQRMSVDELAFDVIRTMRLGAQQYRRVVDLVKVSVFQLGFTEEPTYDQICLQAIDLGYGLCPNEAGVVIKLANLYPTYQDRWLVVTPPLSESLGGLGVFELMCNQEGLFRLGVTSVYPGLRFPLDTELILELL